MWFCPISLNNLSENIRQQQINIYLIFIKLINPLTVKGGWGICRSVGDKINWLSIFEVIKSRARIKVNDQPLARKLYLCSFIKNN